MRSIICIFYKKIREVLNHFLIYIIFHQPLYEALQMVFLRLKEDDDEGGNARRHRVHFGKSGLSNI
jgi:hypothetical protein